MAVAPPRRRRMLAVSLVLAIAVALAAGCAGKDADEPSTAPPGNGTQGFGSNPATPTPAAATTAPAPKPPAYPTTPKAYAEAVLAAWKQKQTSLLGELTTALVQEQIIQIPGPPNQDWEFRDCEDDATVYCGFFNAIGDWISIRIDKDKLGKAHAASAVEFDATVYPDDSFEYIKEFIEAWDFGNIARMQSLAKPEVVEYVRHGPAPENPAYATAGGGGDLHQVKITNPDGFHLILDVGTTLLGMPDAIVGYSP